uniref:SPIN-DOC-like zinc-finger domain-containing protein n=1 Tax=Gasterosteus aculeatus TaxID=69293 RepID=G3NDL4_GASAC
QATAKSNDQENCVFQVKWEVDHLFTEFKGKPMCLVCLEPLSAMKDFNLSCHYNTLHKVKYEKYTEAARAALIADLKSKVHKQQNFLLPEPQPHRRLHSRRRMLLRLRAKAKEPLSDGEIVKRCAVETARAFGDANLVKNVDTVSLSRRTVTRRIFDINDHVEGKMKQVMHDCKYFSLALDERTDVMDVSQLLIFTRTVDRSVEVHEELLKMVSLHDTTKGTDIFNAVSSVALTWLDKLSAVVTDGAPAMQGRRTGFAGLLQQS